MHHVSALNSHSPIKSNCKDLVRGLQELELHHSRLKAHGGDSLGQYLTASTVDRACSTHWADYTRAVRSLRTLTQFALSSNTALPFSKQTHIWPRRVTTSTRHPAAVKAQRQASFYSPPHKGLVVRSPVSRLRGGTFCLPVLLLQGLASGHASFYREGQALVSGCGHIKEACRSKKTCRECSGRHHTLLHRPANSPPSQPSEQPTSSGTQVYCAKGRVVHKGFTHTFPRTL